MYDTTFQAKVWPVLISAFNEYIAPVFNGRLSYKVAASLTPLPVGIYQSQDNGGKSDDYIGMNGWEGLVTIRCLDTTISGAWGKALEVAEQLPNMDHVQYDINTLIVRPIELPVEKLSNVGNVYTAGLIVSIIVHPK